MRTDFIISIFLFSTSALSFTCPNIRLDKDFPGGKPVNKAKYKTMQSARVQNQDLGICYAYGAAQIADAVRHKRQLEKGKKPDSRTASPVFLAVNTRAAWDEKGLYYKSNGDPHFPFEGGHLCDAFETAGRLGTCPKDTMDTVFDSNKLNEETFFEKLLQVEENLKVKRNDIDKKFIKDISDIYERPISEKENLYEFFVNKATAVNDSITGRNNEIVACTYSAIDELYDSFKDVFGDAFKINRFLFKNFFSPDMFDNTFEISFIFQTICPIEDRLKVNTGSSCNVYDVKKSIASGKSSPFTQKILEELKADSLPVGISYCSKILSRGPTYGGITTKTSSSLKFKKTANGKNDCGNHASIITGSRWNPKTSSCELLVRNSWGAQCKSYKKHFPSKKYYKEKNPDKTPSQYDIKCENGSIWIDYKALEKNVYRVQHL